jgi:iron(III) transport system substrate-binding protein
MIPTGSAWKRNGSILCEFICIVGLLSSCSLTKSILPSVTVYTSVDQPFSEPLFLSFEKSTGIRVKAIYDVEAAKTTGLANRLITEKQHPQADIFWNSEVLQTIRLEENGILQKYESPNSPEIPPGFRDPHAYWNGVTARARVIIINTKRIQNIGAIDSLEDLLDAQYPARMIGIALPLFGTSATHAAALYQSMGAERGYKYFEKLKERGIQVVDGNAVVRDLVAAGDLYFGLTDSDDACTILQQNAPITIILPDQDNGGTLVIPSTVALIAGAPHPQQGQALIDFLLSRQAEQMLLESNFSHIPLHPDLKVSEPCIPNGSIHAMNLNFHDVYTNFDQIQSDLKELFLR